MDRSRCPICQTDCDYTLYRDDGPERTWLMGKDARYWHLIVIHHWKPQGTVFLK